GVVLWRLEKRTGETGKPARTGNREQSTMGDREAIPIAAGNFSGHWGAGDCLWRASDCGAVSNLQGNLELGRKSKLKVESSKSKKKREKDLTQRAKRKQ